MGGGVGGRANSSGGRVGNCIRSVGLGELKKFLKILHFRKTNMENYSEYATQKKLKQQLITEFFKIHKKT